MVGANATALPGWVQQVHPSHQPVLVGGVVGCVKCASIVATRATGTALARPCDGVMRLGNTSRLRCLCTGRLPYHLDTWPGGLAEAGDVRPIVYLDRSQEEWRISSEGTLALAFFGRWRAALACSGDGPTGHSGSFAL